MPASGLTELTIRFPNKLVTTKSGYISGTEMATLSSRRSPSDVGSTEQAANHFDRDRTGMPANGWTELTI